jgi:hypothetical protein
MDETNHGVMTLLFFFVVDVCRWSVREAQAHIGLLFELLHSVAVLSCVWTTGNAFYHA